MTTLTTVTLETGQLRKVRELVALAATYAAVDGDHDEERMLLRLQRHLRRSTQTTCRTIERATSTTTIMPPIQDPVLTLVGAPS